MLVPLYGADHDPGSDVSFPSSPFIVHVGLVRDSFDS